MADKRRRRQQRTGFPFACKSNLRLFTSGRSRLKVATFALHFLVFSSQKRTLLIVLNLAENCCICGPLYRLSGMSAANSPCLSPKYEKAAVVTRAPRPLFQAMPIETSSKRSLAVEIVTIVAKSVDFKATLASSSYI